MLKVKVLRDFKKGSNAFRKDDVVLMPAWYLEHVNSVDVMNVEIIGVCQVPSGMLCSLKTADDLRREMQDKIEKHRQQLKFLQSRYESVIAQLI